MALAVVAVGGNALIRDGVPYTMEGQLEAVVETVSHVVGMIEAGWDVVLSHGNGPQVGFVLLRSELSRDRVHPVPLDSAVAETQGDIGYHFQLALTNELARRGLARTAATVVTQVVVDEHDPAFSSPSKPVGPFMTEEQARHRERADGWSVVEDAGRGWRRCVASPAPLEIVELPALRTLIQAGVVVVAAGGGGVPVVRRGATLYGVPAVVDKDHASSLLAGAIQADVFVISTGVEKVCLRFGTPEQVALEHLTLAEARRYLAEGHFKKGSMAPKIEAVIRYLEGGGARALITDPSNLTRALRGEAGTVITRS